ncbi:MAG: DUF4932 domain-containing protein [Ignavibacteria bacterium]|nr:DUF4932 domain-containing protein [Ignavibacteria bacterium]
MRIFAAYVLFAGFTALLQSQPEPNSLLPRIDQRVELLSITFMLSGMEEFNDSLNPNYSKSIHDHFDKYAGHKLITHLKQVRDSLAKNNIDFGYWDAPGIAVHLSYPPGLKPLVPSDDSTNNDFWDNRSLITDELVSLLQDFYKSADCETFFHSQQEYYDAVHRQYEKDGKRIDRDWIAELFSIKPSEKYYAIIALCLRNGAYLRVNYGDEMRDTYTIFGCTAFDKNGIPETFGQPYFVSSMLHEYIHCFVNQLVEKHSLKLKGPAEILLGDPVVFGKMKDTFYGNWRYLLYESLVRAFSILYGKYNYGDKEKTEKEILFQEEAGFYWMRDLVKLYDKYITNRSKYEDMASFMPVVVKFFRKLAEKYD